MTGEPFGDLPNLVKVLHQENVALRARLAEAEAKRDRLRAALEEK